MTGTADRRATVLRRVRRGSALSLVYVLPLPASLALVYLVTRAYMACSGSEVLASGKHLSQSIWLVALPVLMYCAVSVSLYLPWKRETLVEHLLRTAAAIAVVGLIYVYLSARYFTLTQGDCVDGLPTWWPDWLPAR